MCQEQQEHIIIDVHVHTDSFLSSSEMKVEKTGSTKLTQVI